MNHVRGMAVILGFLVAGEAVSRLLPLPIPGSVVGMVLLASALGLGLVKLSRIEAVADFLVKHLAFFFVPAGVGLMAHFDLLERHWPAILVSVTLGTAAAIALIGLFHKTVSRVRRRH